MNSSKVFSEVTKGESLFEDVSIASASLTTSLSSGFKSLILSAVPSGQSPSLQSMMLESAEDEDAYEVDDVVVVEEEE